MCGRSKCLASARAMVPLPLAAGPSTAITGAWRTRGPLASFALASFAESSVKAGSVKRCALTVGHAYGKAPPASDPVLRPPICPRIFVKRLETYFHGETRMGHQAHLPQVLDPLLRSRQGQSGALHRLRT